MLLKQLTIMFDSQPYLLKMYRAMFVTSYFGMLRVGEITQSQHVVKACDVQIGDNKKKIRIILRSLKMHWISDPPQTVKLTAHPFESKLKTSDRENCCPFTMLRQYLLVRKSYKTEREQFFVFSDRTPIGPEQYRKTLKLCLSLAGFTKENYDTHSMRAGRSCDLLKMGVSVEMIKKLGHWKLNAVFKYLKLM